VTDTVDTQPSPARAELREEIEQWLEAHWDADLDVSEWWRLVAEAGWTAPHLTPEQGGRGLPRR